MSSFLLGKKTPCKLANLSVGENTVEGTELAAEIVFDTNFISQIWFYNEIYYQDEVKWVNTRIQCRSKSWGERERGRVSDSEKEMEDIDNSAQDFFWK